MSKSKLIGFIIVFLCGGYASIGSALNSTQVIPINPGRQSVMYPSTTYASAPAAGEDFSQWTTCPATPACADINDVYPAGASASTCPTKCKVDRVLGTLESTGRYTSYVPAACPVGYSQVGVFNVGIEVAQYPNPASPNGFTVENIPTVALAQQYVARGFSCTPASPTALTGGPSFSACHSGGGAPGKTQLSNAQGGWTTAATGTVTYFWLYDNSTCYTLCGTWAHSPGSCSLSTTDREYNYWYAPVVCNGGSGFFATGKTTPTSVACARVRPTWVPQNPTITVPTSAPTPLTGTVTSPNPPSPRAPTNPGGILGGSAGDSDAGAVLLLP